MKQGRRRLRAKQELKIIELLHSLFSSGFTLADIVAFLERSHLISPLHIKQMKEGLINGQNISSIMASIGFSEAVVTQLSLADEHGDLTESLGKLEHYLKRLTKVRRKLTEVATYPVVLLLFLLMIIIGLRKYLLPQIASENAASHLLAVFPNVILGLFLLFILSLLIYAQISKKVSRLKMMLFWSKFPLISTFIKQYLTAYYAREWGILISQGLELHDIVQLMQGQYSRLFSEIGVDMEKSLLEGDLFSNQVKRYAFFLPELSLIIEYGEAKDKLGTELEVYSEEMWQQFFSQLEKAMQLVQPIIFIFVALVVLMIYAAMLLPMYQNMEGYF